jgi:hypothetical protein
MRAVLCGLIGPLEVSASTHALLAPAGAVSVTSRERLLTLAISSSDGPAPICAGETPMRLPLISIETLLTAGGRAALS